jgi:glycosyltransferase involved in cell wall biosynthesis
MGLCDPRARAGIWRYATHLLRELAALPECEVVACEPGGSAYLQLALAYLRSAGNGGGLRALPAQPLLMLNQLIWYGTRMAGRRLQSRASRNKALNMSSPTSFRATNARANTTGEFTQSEIIIDSGGSINPGIRGAGLLQRMLRATGRLQPADLGRCNIFHTPFDGIAEVTKGVPGLVRFITMHDLIPLLRPEWTPKPVQENQRAAMASIADDDWVLCDSEYTRHDFLNYKRHHRPEQVRTVHLAAGEEFLPCSDEPRIAEVRRKCGIPEGAEYFLTLCTLEPRKNLAAVIRALAAVVQQGNTPGLHLVLAGPSVFSAEQIYEVAEASALRKRLIFTGHIPDEELAPLYSGALGFVYLSLFEGFGLPPLEAMKCGTPVITSDVTSIPEVVGDAAIQVNPHDLDALAGAMLRVYKDSELRREMSRKSIERAKLFSWRKCAEDTFQAYRTAAWA